MGRKKRIEMPAPGDIYQSSGAKKNATFKRMEEFRKQAVMLDAINDYKAEMEAEMMANQAGPMAVGNKALGEESDEEIDIDALLDEDDEITNKYREEMMGKMMAESKEQATWRANGHGKLEEIVEEEFLPTCQKSKRMVCSFFHREMRRCDILHEFLRQLAPRYMGTKFVTMCAEKAPFFVVKLGVQVLPCMVMFEDGKVCGRMDGLDLIGGDDGLELSTIEVVLGASGVIDFKPPADWIESNKKQYADIVGLNEATQASDSDEE